MISDSTLYTLALFLGAASMLLIVLYHWLEVNARADRAAETQKLALPAAAAPAKAKLKN